MQKHKQYNFVIMFDILIIPSNIYCKSKLVCKAVLLQDKINHCHKTSKGVSI